MILACFYNKIQKKYIGIFWFYFNCNQLQNSKNYCNSTIIAFCLIMI